MSMRRSGRARTALGIAALALVAGCSGADSSTGSAEAPSPPPSSAPGSATASVPPTPSSAPAAPAPGPITIAVAGDVHFEGVLRERLDDPATALAPATRALAAADLAVVNLETSIGTGGRPEPGKRYPFRAPPRALAALSAAGIDIATLANNHALDYGRPMLAQTFAAAAAAGEAEPPLAVIGIGANVDEAFRPAMNDVRGTVVATLGATVADEDPTADPTGHWAATPSHAGTADAVDPRRLLRAVGAADREADVVVVYLHWGIQGERCPSRSQRSLAGRLVDRGADLVVGSHTHGLQGDGPLRGGYVAYGLGNYVWYTPSTPTGVLTLTVRPAPAREGRAEVTKATWEPAWISGNGLPQPLRGAGQRAFDAELDALRSCAGFPS